jgi:hypothetical protein
VLVSELLKIRNSNIIFSNNEFLLIFSDPSFTHLIDDFNSKSIEVIVDWDVEFLIEKMTVIHSFTLHLNFVPLSLFPWL